MDGQSNHALSAPQGSLPSERPAILCIETSEEMNKDEGHSLITVMLYCVSGSNDYQRALVGLAEQI